MDVVDRFLAQAGSFPSHVAVSHNGKTTSYAELCDLVRRYATSFARTSEPTILIALPQGADAYAAMLAAGLCGGFYVPVNTSSPKEKIRRIAEIVRPDVVLASSLDAGREYGNRAPKAFLLTPETASHALAYSGQGRRHRLAYVMFTSGSTGEPKGVMVPRSALDHYVDWLIPALELSSSDRIAQHPNIGFDVSVFGIYGGLCSGAAVFPVSSPGDRLLPARLIQRERLTVWISVPSVVSLMLQAHDVTAHRLSSVRLFTFCGEPLLQEHLIPLFAACPRASVQNTYGPTEATVSITSIMLRMENFESACGNSVAIGDSIPGSGIELVGGIHRDHGEIVITGAQLASGYWEDPVRTGNAFKIVDTDSGPVLGYYTGDWAERRNGMLFFKERMDFQVKIKGHRLELDEVSSAIRSMGWSSVCVFLADKDLVAVVEHRDGHRLELDKLRAELALKLEDYAVPTDIKEISSMPRNQNDKIDREAVLCWYQDERVRRTTSRTK